MVHSVGRERQCTRVKVEVMELHGASAKRKTGSCKGSNMLTCIDESKGSTYVRVKVTIRVWHDLRMVRRRCVIGPRAALWRDLADITTFSSTSDTSMLFQIIAFVSQHSDDGQLGGSRH